MAEAASAPFVWGSGGSKDSMTRRRQLAEALLKSGMDYSPVQHWTQGLARLSQALVGGWEAGQLDKQEKSSNEALAKALEASLGSSGTAAAPAAMPATAPAAPSMTGSGVRTMTMPSVAPEVKDGIVQTASALGISPVDLATAISYETAGTFDPTKSGPRTQWGQHRGLIQFGEPQAKQFGVDWSNPVGSQLGPNGAVAAYLRNAGVKPGMGLMDVYSAINAGGVGRYGASDANNGGAPGTVADKVNQQMAGHRAKAQALFADLPAPGASPVSMETGHPGFAIPEGAAPAPAMTGANFNAISAGQPLDPTFQSEGMSQPWMGTALGQPQTVAAPLPPPRPIDLAMPQADMPAPGAVEAMGQLPPAAIPDLSNENDAGSRIMAATGGTGVPAAGASPFAGITQALMGGQQAPAPASPVAAALSQTQAAPAASGAPANPMAQLATALMRAGRTDEALKIAMSLNQPVNGVTMGDRLVDPRSGRVIADFTGANGGRSNKFGLTPIYGTRNGKTVMLQAGERGDVVETKLPEGVELPTGVERVDLGTSIGLLDKRTGQMVGTIPKDLAGAERAKVEGKAAGEASTGLNDAISKSEETLRSIGAIRNHPGRDSFGAQGKDAALPIVGNGIPGTAGRDFVAQVDQLKGKAFLEAFSMLKGGGAISEVEGRTATDAIARLDRAQSKDGFDKALDDLEGVIRRGMENARKKAGQGGAPAPAAPASDGWSEVAPGVRIREKR